MTAPAAEPTPHRDLGPFRDAGQARAQYDAQMHGIPDYGRGNGHLPLVEACLITGLPGLTPYEQEALAGTSPEAAVVLAGLIIRAHLTGRAAA